ncbi:Rieske 2Fe-2S domain-containing protein [Nocardia cyriacigeorgica]|uniref:3-ketosteroid-9-alpha-monooxygenase, oxygenase component n=2 Tax=Nocardia cyriacigeorgica TaxID=135487 RepID=A0A4U8W8J4_9NOCA|nr:Rieske 2Fe-2S domain-containing protein [Nocardia cyriacigeorgica]MBF6099562.1 3-ketosteroid-9-alpha-hydroxylase subunit A [Nocardia cyriacigeorgica]MBF6160110.1 3-ketosteroid-9-alpha-hydroxylase subunit A [Nocardia cyriacigeorgica]MBF6199194.1 3-ketosteroid-9-alpha-hydroxylase subunit A [Nocardia cyriacigeorgica]MBF6319314.1 3-ketosteroid-9-alpha-hydroxylase subunit A [Nocardia cyriacigeorgica]MBF6535316.1 3-ketosteroid-9-alpha-hydroxylase subunit A [Nocardia cyriacigeorgica]
MAVTPQGSGTKVRELDVGSAPTRYARGWHCLGLAKTFRDGKPHSVNAFGTKLVVWADTAGELRVLDAYCRHMGGDLSMGEIKGDDIACPFHDWRWGASGKCTSIPYARRVPPLARTRKWTTLERNGQLFVWHDHEGNPPPPEVTIPYIKGTYTDADGNPLEELNPEWTEWTWNSLLIEGANCREIIDNVVDMAHFFYIHFAFPTYFKNVFEGHVATQFLETKGRPDVGIAAKYGGDNLLKSEASYFGPSYMINPLVNIYGGYEITVNLINCHYPVTHDSFVLQWGLSVEKPKGLDDATAAKLAKSMTTFFGDGFLQDVEIWKHKSKVENPLLCEEDGPVYQLRRWYEQFYVDVADVTEKMTQRFEFEVDTTKANEAWEAEVAENLRRKREAEAAEAESNAAEAGV